MIFLYFYSVFKRKKAGRESLIMLPRMGSIFDCNVVERTVVKPLKTWWDSMETFLFKSNEKILEYSGIPWKLLHTKKPAFHKEMNFVVSILVNCLIKLQPRSCTWILTMYTKAVKMYSHNQKDPEFIESSLYSDLT